MRPTKWSHQLIHFNYLTCLLDRGRFKISATVFLSKNKSPTRKKKIHTCGSRNSYSKTDSDATFMKVKEDAMKNGQLKPGYNVQHGVDSEYVAWLTVGPQPTDTTTLIPFIKSMENLLYFKYFKTVADACYESEEKYFYANATAPPFMFRQLFFLNWINHIHQYHLTQV